MFVGAEPERLHCRHPELAGATNVLEQAVAHEDGVGSRDPERLQRALEDRRMRLALADLGREDGEVQPLNPSPQLEVAGQEPAGVERIGDEPELEPALAQRLEQRRTVLSELPRRVPGHMLGLEEAVQLLVRDLDAEIAEELTDKFGVLELLDRAGCPEEGLVPLAEVRRQALDLREVVSV